MTENSKGKGDRPWSTRAGTIKAGSVAPIEGKDGLTAIVVNKDNAEHVIEAYGEKNKAKLEAAAESGKPFVFRGPMYMKGTESRVMVNHAVEQGAPKPAPTEAEKAAAKEERAAAGKERAAQRDASRVMIETGSVAIGDTVEKDGEKHEVNHIGASYEKDGKSVAYAYFGELGAEMAAKAAEDAAKEAEAAAEEDASPTP